MRELQLCLAVAPLAVADLRFRPLALGDVVEKDSDASALGVFDTEGVNVIPASELFGFVFKSHRLARQGDPAVNLEPMFFVLGGDFAPPSARGIFNAGLPFKRRAELQETIVDRLSAIVKQDFDRAEALVNRFEQRAIVPFRLAQFRLGILACGPIAGLTYCALYGGREARKPGLQDIIGGPDLERFDGCLFAKGA